MLSLKKQAISQTLKIQWWLPEAEQGSGEGGEENDSLRGTRLYLDRSNEFSGFIAHQSNYRYSFSIDSSILKKLEDRIFTVFTIKNLKCLKG